MSLFDGYWILLALEIVRIGVGLITTQPLLKATVRREFPGRLENFVLRSNLLRVNVRVYFEEKTLVYVSGGF